MIVMLGGSISIYITLDYSSFTSNINRSLVSRKSLSSEHAYVLLYYLLLYVNYNQRCMQKHGSRYSSYSRSIHIQNPLLLWQTLVALSIIFSGHGIIQHWNDPIIDFIYAESDLVSGHTLLHSTPSTARTPLESVDSLLDFIFSQVRSYQVGGWVPPIRAGLVPKLLPSTALLTLSTRQLITSADSKQIDRSKE